MARLKRIGISFIVLACIFLFIAAVQRAPIIALGVLVLINLVIYLKKRRR